MAFANANPSSAVTDVELVPAAGSGHKIRVYSVYFSSDTAQTITLESDTATLVWRQYVAENAGQTHFSERGLFDCVPGENLTHTTSAAGNAFISVDYEYIYV